VKYGTTILPLSLIKSLMLPSILLETRMIFYVPHFDFTMITNTLCCAFWLCIFTKHRVVVPTLSNQLSSRFQRNHSYDNQLNWFRYCHCGGGIGSSVSDCDNFPWIECIKKCLTLIGYTVPPIWFTSLCTALYFNIH
jgi:hypothetical protein